MKGKHLLTVSIGVIAIGAAGYGLYRFGMSRGMQMAGTASNVPAGAQEAGDADPATGRKVLYWHDPMVPGQKFDKPGKSPFMDMQLVPVYADAGSGESTVAISPRVQLNLGVRIPEVNRGVVQS